jgi:hypothetical protein
MKTAIQELIVHLEMLKSRVDMVDVDSLIEYATNSLEKEKEQIIDAGNGGVLINFLHREKIAKMSDDELRVSLVEDTISYGEQYFNQTYNQNK